MTVTIAEVLDTDGAIWLKSDPFDPAPFHWNACVRLNGGEGLTRGDRLRLPCGAVLQFASRHPRHSQITWLYFESESRPPPLEDGMVLDVDTGGACAGSVASCEGEPCTPEARLFQDWLDQQRAWLWRMDPRLSWCNPGRPWP